MLIAPAITIWHSIHSSRRRHDAGDAANEPFPPRHLLAEHMPPGGRELVILRAPVVVAGAPLGAHEPASLEAVQGGVERTGRHQHDFTGALLDALRDTPSVHRPRAKRGEHEELECPLDQLA